MKVSIITVVWNGKKTIQNAIDSVLNQTYSNIEYIVIDGDSTDGTVSVVQNYGDRISKFISEPDKGLYDAMNKGIKLASGDIIGFINSDDLLNSNDCIECIVKEFIKSDADIIYGDKVYVAYGDISKRIRYWKAGNFNRDNYKKGWMTPHLSTYIKKDLYVKYGNFRIDFKIAADYELMFRFIYKYKAKVHYLPKVIAKMRVGGVSNSSLKNIITSNYEVYRSWEVNGFKVSPLIIFQKPISKLRQFFFKKSKQ